MGGCMSFYNKKYVAGACMEKLCEDISSEILIRLQAKAIAQLRCVCKRWNTLLREAKFIESHLRRSINNNNDRDEILLLLNNASGGLPFEALSIASPNVELINFIKFPVNFPSEEAQTEKITVIGAANGLICLSVGYYDDRVIYVWNPSLSALLTVPPYTMPVPSLNPDAQYYANCFDRFGFDLKNDDYNPNAQYYARCSFRFGFDPKNYDYKILKLISVQHIKQDSVEWLQVEVYSMRSGCWKLITQRFPSSVSYFYSNIVQVCVDGHIHWLCFNVDLKIKTIVAFDFAAESFREISLPDPTNIVDYDDRLTWVDLGVFGGKLCVISCARDVDYCQVMVLDANGSWANNGFSHFHKGGMFPYGFTLKNNFIYEDCNEGIHLYNPAAPFNKVKPFHKRYFSYLIIIPYVESLVWVTPPSPTC